MTENMYQSISMIILREMSKLRNTRSFCNSISMRTMMIFSELIRNGYRGDMVSVGEDDEETGQVEGLS